MIMRVRDVTEPENLLVLSEKGAPARAPARTRARNRVRNGICEKQTGNLGKNAAVQATKSHFTASEHEHDYKHEYEHEQEGGQRRL